MLTQVVEAEVGEDKPATEVASTRLIGKLKFNVRVSNMQSR